MNKTEHAVKNRLGLSIIIEITKPKNPAGLVFLQHGVSGCKEEPHIQTIRDQFLNNDYIVVSIDSTNGFGASDGNLENFTATTHYHDLEDIVLWCGDQDFYREPFILTGHSMGGFSVLKYTIDHPEKVKAVAPISIAVSGDLLDQAYEKKDPELHAQWQREGRILRQSRAHPDRTGYLSFNFIEDFKKYNLLESAHKIQVPVLLMVGENDPSTPPGDQQSLFDILKSDKELSIVKNAGHSFIAASERKELARYLDHWIKRIVLSA